MVSLSLGHASKILDFAVLVFFKTIFLTFNGYLVKSLQENIDVKGLNV